ncbi:MAG: GlsB/YeaQ/YmgE family stress response membrane protein [Candidatus Nanopelagicales bacterium]|jgi:uncharacterized membrane protein YeaQ/YmgE (transglycosylase-associated protein family)|nr:GlsB/YeaQ/YmgE family stress response membrane protein [Candidatus Nanopelagicales bacterium]MDP4907496.1 GlsB/YeaQ/YmgE family stress response membrane protein [Candidatus Nanopelagicales bacterium]
MSASTWDSPAMDMSGFFSVLAVGIIIGLVARILVPSMQPIGCIMTIICGIVGAGLGLWVGVQFLDQPSGFSWITLLVQILIAVVLVAIVAGLFRRSSAD